MKKFFLLFSLLAPISCLLAPASCLQPPVSCLQSPASREYQLSMNVRGGEMTGLCLMEVCAPDSVVGTVINEFGVKIFDFTYAQGKAKVLNVMEPIDKWYIRRVLRADMAFIITHMLKGENATCKRRQFSMTASGEMHMSNEKYRLYYTFIPMTHHETD